MTLSLNMFDYFGIWSSSAVYIFHQCIISLVLCDKEVQMNMEFFERNSIFKTPVGNAPECLGNSFTFPTAIHACIVRSSYSFHLYTPKPQSEMYRTKMYFLFIYLDFSSFIYSKLNSVQHFKSQYLRWINPKSSTTDI